MINQARLPWSYKCKAKRSYQLRTGQMKLPVRKIEPVQYIDSKESVYPELPNSPIVGNIYTHSDKIVKCIITDKLKCQICILQGIHTCASIRCIPTSRDDGKYIALIQYNA